MKVPLNPSPLEPEEVEELEPELEGAAPELVLLPPAAAPAFPPAAVAAVLAVATGTRPEAVTVTVAVEPAAEEDEFNKSPFLDL